MGWELPPSQHRCLTIGAAFSAAFMPAGSVYTCDSCGKKYVKQKGGDMVPAPPAPPAPGLFRR